MTGPNEIYSSSRGNAACPCPEDCRPPGGAEPGFRFAERALRRDIARSDRLRREIAAKWDKKALVRLGHEHVCTKVSLAGTELQVHHRDVITTDVIKD